MAEGRGIAKCDGLMDQVNWVLKETNWRLLTVHSSGSESRAEQLFVQKTGFEPLDFSLSQILGPETSIKPDSASL